jgi:anti-sigma factor RsiW
MAKDDRPAVAPTVVASCDEIQPLVRDAIRGGLDEATRARVYEHLATCPACAKLADEERALDALLEQKLPQYAAPLALKRRLQARLPPLAATPAPPRRRALGRWLTPLSAAVAACAVLAVGLRHWLPAPGEPMVDEAVADHLRVVYRDHPTDVTSGGPHQVKPWFTGRLDFALPTVFGGDDNFTLEGGSVGYYLDRKAAVLVYKRRLHTESLFVFRADGFSFPRADRSLGRVSAAVRHERGFSVVVWRDGELGYALVSDLNTEELVGLATHVVNGS